jgi:hypothetical protein
MFQKKWHASLIANHILARVGKEPLNYTYYLKTYPDIHAAAIRIFGSWKDALEDCGLNYCEIRKYNQWSKEKIVAEIKKLKKEKKPLNSNYIQENHKPLYMAAVKRYKSWGKAVSAAKIDYKKIRLRKKLSVEEIKAEIIKLHKKKVDLAYPNMRANYQNLQAAAMRKLGDGSWDKARKLCGIHTNYRLPKHKRK